MAASGGHILVPKAMKVLRFAIERGTRFIKGAQRAAQAVETQAEPAYARVIRQPFKRLAAIKQSQSRWYSTKQAINNSVRHYSSQAKAASRNAYASSCTAAALGRASTRAPFASQLRPNLTGGTLSRTAGGYGLGGGRVGGVRHFSHSPAAPAQVVNNVSQAVRAFWLSGTKARYDGFNERTGEKRYRAVSEVQDEARHKMSVANIQAKGSFIDFKVSPTITAIGPLANIPRSTMKCDCETETLNNATLMSNLAIDFARALKDLAAIMNDLKHLSTLGDLPISLEDSHTLRVRFPGCDIDTVEALCRELNIRRGIVGQDEDFDVANGTDMALLFPFAPSKTPSELMFDIAEIKARPAKRAKRDHVDWKDMLSQTAAPSPGYSRRSATSDEHDIEVVDELVDNPWSPSGYSSLHASEAQDDDVARYFEPQYQETRSRTPQNQAAGYEGLEGIYRFLEECDRATRR